MWSLSLLLTRLLDAWDRFVARIEMRLAAMDRALDRSGPFWFYALPGLLLFGFALIWPTETLRLLAIFSWLTIAVSGITNRLFSFKDKGQLP
ncbi:MAG: hypothetical protein AAGH83_11160, partial [Pseudomonadota bacterium]